MDSEARIAGEEAEVVRSSSMESFVKERLKYLVEDRRKWWATDFFDFMEKDDDECFRRLREFREEARSLSDEALVVLVGNTITEEALPNYSRRFANLFPDPTGTSQNPWSFWGRNWESEEMQHLFVLHDWLLTGGRVSLKSVLRSSYSLVGKGMKGEPGIFEGLAYPVYQEPATAISHKNMAEIAKKQGAQTLYDICINISGDESRHARFYSEIVTELMRRAPNNMMIAYYKLTKDGIAVMPGRNMTDETYTEPPTLFEHFAGVADRIGVYTTAHHADVFEKLNKAFKVGEVLGLRDEAAEAQERLLKLPDRLRKYADWKKKRHRVAKPVAFDWIYGRAA